MSNTENISSDPPAPTQSGSGVDLQRLVRLFPAHKCGMHITHNQHRDYYESAEEYINRDGGEDGWKDDEAKLRAIQTDEIWELQWYPETPVGFLVVYAPTFPELIELARNSEANVKFCRRAS